MSLIWAFFCSFFGQVVACNPVVNLPNGDWPYKMACIEAQMEVSVFWTFMYWKPKCHWNRIFLSVLYCFCSNTAETAWLKSVYSSFLNCWVWGWDFLCSCAFVPLIRRKILTVCSHFQWCGWLNEESFIPVCFVLFWRWKKLPFIFQPLGGSVIQPVKSVCSNNTCSAYQLFVCVQYRPEV